ncbi:unnamed protein product, partial [Porites lobata]
KAAFEIIGLNLKISVIWQNINMIKQDNPNIKYTELKDQSMMDFHGLLGLLGMEEINQSRRYFNAEKSPDYRGAIVRGRRRRRRRRRRRKFFSRTACVT